MIKDEKEELLTRKEGFLFLLMSVCKDKNTS